MGQTYNLPRTTFKHHLKIEGVGNTTQIFENQDKRESLAYNVFCGTRLAKINKLFVEGICLNTKRTPFSCDTFNYDLVGQITGGTSI